MAIASVPGPGAMAMASELKSAVPFASVLLDDAGGGVALDELALAAGGLAEGSGGEAVEVAHRAGGGLVQERDGVACEQLAFAAGAAEAEAQVLGGVVGREGRNLEAVVQTRVQRAIAAQREAVA